MISPGKAWESEIDSRLKTADIILLLISSELTASDYHWNTLVKRAMERHEERKARVIPILLRRVDNWRYLFGKIKALPNDEYGNEKPITDWGTHDNAFANIAKGIREVVAELSDPFFDVKKSFQQIKAEVLPITNILKTVFAIVTSSIAFRASRSRPRRRNTIRMIRVKPIFAFPIVIGGIYIASLFTKALHPAKITALISSTPSSVTVGNAYDVHCPKNYDANDARNLRSEPSEKSRFIMYIYCYKTVTVTGNLTQGWYPVKASTGETGYLPKEAIDP